MSSSLDPSMGELLESSAGLGTYVERNYRSRSGWFCYCFPQPQLQLRCRLFYQVLFRDSIFWEALNKTPLCGSFNCSELATPQAHSLELVVHRLVPSFALLHLYRALRPCVHRSALHKALALPRPHYTKIIVMIPHC